MSRQREGADRVKTRGDPERGEDARADGAPSAESDRFRRVEALRQARLEGRLEIDPAVIAERLLDP